MKIAVVVPWFGKELKGGAEQQAWQIASRLSIRGIDTTVLTTCSKEFLSDWSENFYQEDDYNEDGVKIKRFKVRQRKQNKFDVINAKLLNIPKSQLIPGVSPLTEEEENIYLEENIYSEALQSYIIENKSNYDLFIFLPYLFPNIIKGIDAVKQKAISIPCLHDECYAYLQSVQNNFYNAEKLIFLSDGEYDVAKKIFGPSIIGKSKVLYAGVETKIRNNVKYENYLLYLGRRDIGKNTHILIKSFDKFIEETNSDLKLIIAGIGDLPIQPKSKNIIDVGLVSDAKKEELLSNCLALINPSENESFSRVIFESWYAKKPVIIHQNCLATYNALKESNMAGYFAKDVDTFINIFRQIEKLSVDEIKAMGELGFRYADEVANWDKVISRYIETIQDVIKKKEEVNDKTIIIAYFDIGPLDAVGYDILEEYNTLSSYGYQVYLYAEVFEPDLFRDDFNIIDFKTLNNKLKNKENILIYHHANYWEEGNAILNSAECRIIVKYHNITPGKYYESYYPHGADNCNRGREQTKDITSSYKASVFFADSKYNAKELIELGVNESRVSVQIPFTRVIKLSSINIDEKLYYKLKSNKTINVLFVGRVAPNKGHKHLIETIKSYIDNFDKNIHLNIIGGMDPNLKTYYLELQNLIKSYGLNDFISLKGAISDKELKTYYVASDAFLLISEHEGFCIPIIEAQYHKLPIVALGKTAVKETVGNEQLIFDEVDYLSFATALKIIKDDIKVKDYLIEKGLQNFRKYHNGIIATNLLYGIENISFNKMVNHGVNISSNINYDIMGNNSSNDMVNHGVKILDTSLFKHLQIKILLIKVDHMGDLILSVPAITKLANKYEGAKIDIIVGSWNVDIAKQLNFFEHIYTLDYFKVQSSEAPQIIDKKVDLLLKNLEHYDIAIDLRRQRDTRFLLTRVAADLKVGYKTHLRDIDSQIDICLDSEIDYPGKVISHNKKPIALQTIELIDALPKEQNDYVKFPPLSKIEKQGKQVAIFPKAGNSIKEWPLDRYVFIVNHLCEDQDIDKVNIYLGKHEENISKQFKGHHKLHIHIGLEFKNLCDSVEKNRIALVNNSFGAHLCSYLNVDTIAIYGGQETVAEWAPVWGENRVIYSDVSCSPCHLPEVKDCPYDLICLKQITQEMVLTEIYKKLNE